MLKRYTLQPMRELWLDEDTKFEFWLTVALAIIQAKATLGRLGLQGHAIHEMIQVLQRDRHAAVMSALAIAAASIGQMCRTFWELMRSEVGELEEPRREKQRGSSAMPWKKNPILTERLMGMSRLVRGAADTAMENVATPEWRDISQSCVERHIFGDATSQVHYMAAKATGLVKRLVVFPRQMELNLEVNSLGVWAGQRVQMELMGAGLSYDLAYNYVQASSFHAVDKRISMQQVFGIQKISESDPRTALSILGKAKLKDCFDPRAYVETGINTIFSRFGM